MRRVFADSLYWIAVSHPRDQWHAAAMRAGHSIRGAEIVTTQEVLGEFLTAFRSTTGLRTIAAGRVAQIYANALVLPQTDQSFQDGLALYQARPDKKYSHVDCISMMTMRRQGIIEALTHDGHFAQEGFTLLL